MTTIRGTVCSVAMVFTLALVGAAPALGATHIWTGGANGLWSATGNWSGGVPTTGEPGGTIVQFNGNTTSSMNIAGLTVDQIHFAGSNNVISGTTGLTISGANLVQNIVSDADGNVLAGSLPLTLANTTVEAVSNSGTLTVDGAIGGTPGLAIAGSANVSLSGTASNTYAGATTVISGTLHIGTSVGFVVAGSSLNVGDGLARGPKLLFENSSDISPQTPVIVNTDSVIDFQNHSDSAKSLTVNGGSLLGANLAVSNAVVMHDGTITLAPTGTLTAGSVNMTGGTISGPGPGVLALGGDLQAASSTAGPSTISAPVRLGASPTITVAAGTAPELSMTGAISETGGSRSIMKAGSGTC
jgi:fibronectin-binding autotransporter adhesin